MVCRSWSVQDIRERIAHLEQRAACLVDRVACLQQPHHLGQPNAQELVLQVVHVSQSEFPLYRALLAWHGGLRLDLVLDLALERRALA